MFNGFVAENISIHMPQATMDQIINAAKIAGAHDFILELPDGAALEMDCYVKNMDIADIEIGMEVQIKLEAYPYNRYGTVNGKVSYISPSSFTNEEMGSVSIVKVQLTDVPEDIYVISELTGSVEIKTGV